VVAEVTAVAVLLGTSAAATGQVAVEVLPETAG
jgi:hypothetical protein